MPSFFDRLPYDIRAIVYKYLEPDVIPPFSTETANVGFYLSCHQARRELNELAPASQGCKDMMANFNNTALHEARIEVRPGCFR